MPRNTVLPGALLLACVTSLEAAESWPTLHRDYQRSGHTDSVVVGPYERKWWRDLHSEMIATRCEAIVAEGLVFVGTLAGKLHALGVSDGRTVWTHETAGPIGASPCYGQGRLLVGSDDAHDRGTLHCLRASTGEVLWTHRTPGGIWASPACDEKNVYVGDRSGIFHAVALADGATVWTLTTGYMILTPASLGPDGRRIVFGSEDMHVYCVSPGGELLWRTPRLPGLSLRDHAPTIWRGLAIVRTAPADAFHTVLGRDGETLEAIQRSIPRSELDEVLLEKWGDLLMAPRPGRRRAEIEGVVRHLRANRHDQSLFALDLEDGSEPWVAPVLYTAGLHNPPTPPTFHPGTGELYTLSRSALTHYVRGVRRYSCLARLDRESGRPDWFWPERGERNWRSFPMIPDETQALGMMGDLVVGTHQGELAVLDPRTGSVTPISPTRDTYAGIFGPGAVEGSFDGARRLATRGFLTGMPNEWHGPDRAIVAIAAGRIFWIAGSQVVCIAGPEIPRTDTGGAGPPEPFRNRLPDVVPGGNVATRGRAGVEASIQKRVLSVDDIRRYVELPGRQSPVSTAGRSNRLREILEAEVLELVRGAGGRPWAPLVVELGISGEERHFWRTSETLRIVSRAIPLLSPPARAEAVAYLDRLVEEGAPLDTPVHESRGGRREPYDLGPGMEAFASRSPGVEESIGDLYGLWAYAVRARRWSTTLARVDRIAGVFDRFAASVPDFDPDDMENDSAQKLNSRIAGVLGAARIFERAGDEVRRDRALTILARLVTERVHHERSDHRLVRRSRGETGGIHRAKIPRYVDLVPELAHMLGEFAGDELGGHLWSLREALPLWYQAYGERMIGGENYISPPHLGRGLFLAWADGAGATAGQLAAKLDQPWGKADLYHIEKLTATLARPE